MQSRPNALIALLLAAALILSLTAALGAPSSVAEDQISRDTLAQVRRTPRATLPAGGNLPIPTRGAGGTFDTAPLDAGAIAQTATAAIEQLFNLQMDPAAMQATAAAGLSGTLTALPAGNYAAEVEATLTAVMQAANAASANVNELQATLTAAAAVLESQLSGEITDLTALLDALSAHGSVTVDPTTGTIHATVYITEAETNTLVDAAVLAMGMNPDTVSVDYVPGYVWVYGSVDGIAIGLQFTFVIVDGYPVPVLTAATLNGRAVPVEAVPQESLDAAWNSVYAAVLAEVAALAGPSLTVSVQQIAFDDNGALLAVVLTVG